jgi:urea transport system substrate-binding protein
MRERCILVVEDDSDARELFADRFQLEGYKVVTAATGTEAWELLTRGLVPCAVILDVMLPGMDGTELRARMLRDSALVDVPVIVVTAVGGLVRHAFPNVTAFYRKPVQLEQLVEIVTKHCCSDQDQVC